MPLKTLKRLCILLSLRAVHFSLLHQSGSLRSPRAALWVRSRLPVGGVWWRPDSQLLWSPVPEIMAAMDDTSRTLQVTYEGPSALIGALTQRLRADGRTEVAYDLPEKIERRDALGAAGLILSTVDLLVTTTGTDEYIKDAAKGFINQFRHLDPRVVVDNLPVQTAVSAGSVADELAKLAQLHADGHLTDEEFTQAKARILDNNQ